MNRIEVIEVIVNRKCGWIVGGLENELMDHSKDEIEYQAALTVLKDHEELVNLIYDEVMCETEQDMYYRDLRFVGKDLIIEKINDQLKKWNY